MMKIITNKRIEQAEYRELNRLEKILTTNLHYIQERFLTKGMLKDYWESFYGGKTHGISEAAVGIERIIYKVLSDYGDPVAVPIGSDLFFELDDCFVHIDIKSFVTDNLNDARRNIPVGDNQNSYTGRINVRNSTPRDYSPNLPSIYHYSENGQIKNKPCLTYFLVFINNEYNHKIIGCFLTCMPNGELYQVYNDSILAAGKNPGKIRFNYSGKKFNLLDFTPTRTKFIYYDNITINKNFID